MPPLEETTGTNSPPAPSAGRVPLTRREREILGLLAEGLSGAQIAGKLVLSPETVRTHVRNAMAKLGASTRSQAVALALKGNEIAGEATPAAVAEAARRDRRVDDVGSGPAPVTGEPAAGLLKMLTGLVSLYDVDAGAVYLAEEDGLSLRRVATADGPDQAIELADVIALGDGPLGRAALERRTQLLHDSGPNGGGGGALIAAPMVGAGRLLGVIALAPRASRPVGRSELLLLQAFANRVAEVMNSGGELDERLGRAMERFLSSWSAGPRIA